MSSSVSTGRMRPKDYLDKRIPTNPKYEHVQSKTDTGASMSKYMNKIEEIRKNYKFRKDEIFKRMKITTFAQLAVQVYRINTEEGFDQVLPQDLPGDDASVQDLNGSPLPTLSLASGESGDLGRSDLDSARSTLLSVSQGIGEMDINTPLPPLNLSEPTDESCPYLLLDVRDRDEFDQCRIVTARNFPKSNLSRANHFETKEMMIFRNRPGKIVILYDEDERIAPVVATTLVQRGYDNLFLLSGGMKLAYKLIPEGLLTGSPPQNVTGTKCKNPFPAMQNNFTTSDIDKIEIYLDNALQDKSIGSRLSQASTARSRQAMSSVRSARSSASQLSTGSERPPFR